MPWKTEIDRIVGRALSEAAKAGGNEAERAVRAALDLVELAPDREASHFHLGAIEELMEAQAAELPESTGQAERWRHLGRLDAASRRGQKERASANGGRPRRRPVNLPDPSEEGLVVEQRPGPKAAGHDQDVWLRHLFQGKVGNQRQGVRLIPIGPHHLPDEDRLESGDRVEHLMRPRDVKGGEAVVEEVGDLHTGPVAHVRTPFD